MQSVGVVPADGLGEVGSCRLRKEDPGHLSRPTIKLGFNIFPGNCFAAVSIKSREPTLEFGLLRRGQPHVGCGEAVPELANELEPLSSD